MKNNFLKSFFKKDEECIKNILNKKILVVGCGGVGSNVLKQLVQMGFINLAFVDLDIVEKSNLLRQFYFENQIGKFKVDCIYENLKLIDKKVKLQKFKRNLDNSNYKKLCLNIDLIIDCSDNFETRFLIEKISKELKIDWIYNGAIKDESISSMFYYSDKSKYFNKIFKKRNEGEKCSDSNVLIPSLNLTSSFCVSLVLKYFFKKKKQRYLLKFKLKDFIFSKIKFN